MSINDEMRFRPPSTCNKIFKYNNFLFFKLPQNFRLLKHCLSLNILNMLSCDDIKSSKLGKINKSSLICLRWLQYTSWKCQHFNHSTENNCSNKFISTSSSRARTGTVVLIKCINLTEESTEMTFWVKWVNFKKLIKMKSCV